ncbi:hypothetical protein FQZ97_790980 [compost metagenome]
MSTIWRTRPWIFSTKRLNEPASSPSSSWLSTTRRWVRSPSPAAMSSRLALIRCSGRTRVLARPRPTAPRITSSTAAMTNTLLTMVLTRSSISASTLATWASTPSRFTAVPRARSHFGR